MNTVEDNEKPTLGKAEAHEVNPFLKDLMQNNLVEPRKKLLTTKEPFYSEGTGERYMMSVRTGDAEYYWKDERLHSKVFLDKVSIIKSLSSVAMQMFLFILENMKQNKDIVHIKPSLFLSYAGIKSRSQYYVAALELVDRKIIAKTPSSGAFFINPCIIYSGSVANLMPDAFTEYAKRQVENNPFKPLKRRQNG